VHSVRPNSPSAGDRRGRIAVLAVLGFGQIVAWGGTSYLPAVLAEPVARDTGWPLSWVVGGLSAGMLVSGLVSPSVGALVGRHGGRPVLAGGSAMLALGLALLAAAPGLGLYLAGWIVLGVGMGAGLYDPAFAALGRLYGREARRAITTLTLIAGFASTLCWPFSAGVLHLAGWRVTCLAYAALNLGVALPLYWFALPREEPRAPASVRPAKGAGAKSARAGALLFVIVALVLTLASVIWSAISVNLLALLRGLGPPAQTAVALGTVLGPSQVAARLLDLFAARLIAPGWEMVVSTLLVAAGIGLLSAGSGLVATAVILYGAGTGLRSILRGTLPLALFGAEGYAVLMGRLAFPILIAQSAAPSLGAIILDHAGAAGLKTALFWAAVANVALAALLPLLARRA
jgi:MFS transporter